MVFKQPSPVFLGYTSDNVLTLKRVTGSILKLFYCVQLLYCATARVVGRYLDRNNDPHGRDVFDFSLR